jgi:hypothetical protein
MNKLLVLRVLLVLFVVLYVAAIATGGLPADAPRQATDYEAWANGQATTGSSGWGLLCALGHIADLVGIILLFVRRKMGVYFLIAGFLSCMFVSSGVPSLQTHLTAMLVAFFNIAWGAIVALVFAASDELFSIKREA